MAAEIGNTDWIVDMETMLGCIDHREVRTCSISRVPDKIREANREAYSPKCVSIGPLHRKGRIHLQLMEETKWRYMVDLLSNRANGGPKMLENCCKAIQKLDSVVRASYGGDIELKPHELARIMVLDGCFFLELMFRLYDKVDRGPRNSGEEINPSLGYIDNKIMPVLTDLTLLENQIPLVVLTTLASQLTNTQNRDKELCQGDPPTTVELVKSFFQHNLDPSTGVYHFLHLLHSLSPDSDGHVKRSKKDTLQLKRCATKLKAFGIKIKTPDTNDPTDNNGNGTVASKLRKFVDRFNFEITFDASKRELIIPTLHIKEGTEVKWRNLIAWEQSGIGIGYKFTSYAYFFEGLICSVHDIELLKAKGVIIVDDTMIKDKELPNDKKISDRKLHRKLNRKLLTMFQSITTGVNEMDDRYSKLYQSLNTVKVDGVKAFWILIFTMFWHYCRRFLSWLRHELLKTIVSFAKTYMGTRWKFIGVLSGTALLALTITQTIFAAIGH